VLPLRNSTAPLSRPVTVPAPALRVSPTASTSQRTWRPEAHCMDPAKPNTACSASPMALTAVPVTPPSAASAAIISRSRVLK